MNAEKLLTNIPANNLDLNFTQKVRGRELKDVVTKYFFSNGVLCFQLILHLKGSETVPYGEFYDYLGYKNALSELHEARKNDAVINIPGKLVKTEAASPKVA